MRLEDLLNPQSEEEQPVTGDPWTQSRDPDSAAPEMRSPYEEQKSRPPLLSILLLVLFALWVARGPVLTALGSWLVVGDPVTEADLIVVLSGSPDERGKQGAELYRDGRAPKLLVMGSNVSDAVIALGYNLTGSQLTARVLRAHGVPDEDLTVVTSTGTSTWEEALHTRKHMTEHRLNSVIVVTSKFHTRRTKLTFQKALKGTKARVQVVPSRFDEMRVSRWWTREEELIAVNNEYLKLALYAVKYFLKD